MDNNNTVRLLPELVLPEFLYTHLESVSSVIELINTNTLVPPSESFIKYGCLIINSRRFNYHFLIYKSDEINKIYLLYARFKLIIGNNPDLSFIEKLNILIRFLYENPEEINKIINPYPVKMKCVNNPDGNNDFIIKYDISMKNQYHIYNNVTLNSLPRNEDRPTYYTFLLDVNGIHYGLFENILEMGTAHQFLINENTTPVFIAGELKIEGQNITFNFMSGTFSQHLRLPSKPLLYRLYIEMMTFIFNIHDNKLKTRINEINFTEDVIFPKIKPSLKSIRQMCMNNYTNNNVVVLPAESKCINNALYDLDRSVLEKASSDLRMGENLLCNDQNYQFYNKYLKYKNKYLKLKKIIHN